MSEKQIKYGAIGIIALFLLLSVIVPYFMAIVFGAIIYVAYREGEI